MDLIAWPILAITGMPQKKQNTLVSGAIDLLSRCFLPFKAFLLLTIIGFF